MPNLFHFGSRDDFAELDHNHDSKYSKIDHNHDNKYSKLEHTHDELFCNHENAKLILLHKMPVPPVPANNNIYFSNLLKQICRDYPNTIDGIFICVARPSLKGICIITIYNTSELNGEGLPYYSIGMFFPLSIANPTYKFGTYDYRFESKEI